MRYQFAIDRGGTFTDCILFDQSTGLWAVTKVLSGPDSPLVGMRKLLGLARSAPIPPCEVRIGTTLATNALLERKGVPTGLLITRGFADLLAIGTQARPDLFALRIEKAPPIYCATEEVDARCAADGAVLEAPTRAEVWRAFQALRAAGAESVAIVVLHAYKNPVLELRIAEWATQHGFRAVVSSHQAAREMGLLGRCSTAVLDAYLTPILSDYIQGLENQLPGSRIQMMQSAGGLSPADGLRGPQSLLSGPAGGAIAAARLAEQLGERDVIAFDMGGTSTDVSLIAGEPARRYESQISGVPVYSPMIDIHTVAAGGGSICRFDGDTLTVGPESAGASPGPLAYGHAEAQELTVSDVSFLLGRLATDYFPFPLDRARPEARLAQIREALAEQGIDKTSSEILLGFSEVAVTHMAEAIRAVTVRRGHDPRDSMLLAFGGAGGQHACDIARRLNVRRVGLHRWAGVLSAYGIALADSLATAQADAGRVELDGAGIEGLAETRVELKRRVTAQLQSLGMRPSISEFASLRYRDTETTVQVPLTTPAEMRAHFERTHAREFGFSRPDACVEVAVLHAEARIPGPYLAQSPSGKEGMPLPRAKRMTQVVDHQGRRVDAPVFDFAAIEGCVPLRGPALLLATTGTVFVASDFDATLRGDLLLLTDQEQERTRRAPPGELTELDPIRLEVMSARLSGIAEQMGEALQRSASSTNIRDRLDFSCALFNARGELIANAPHIPVHLGAMGESVRAILRRHPHMLPGDAYVTNDPALGGSHLPDITVVSPVFSPGRDGPSYFVAARGHHADVGGRAPGSMPAGSTNLTEEGVLLSAEKLLSGGRLLEAEILQRLQAGPFPARKPTENLADLKAQLAANALGVRLLLELEQELGPHGVQASMRHLLELSARKVTRAILRLGAGRQVRADCLDDGTPIHVCLTVHAQPGPQGEAMSLDFTQTAPQSAGNHNAPRAVTIACVLYFLRTLLGERLPLNDGCLRPVRLTIPEGSLLSPGPGAAVAAGNVETSMRVCDVLFGASGLCAAAQGTMNNVSFGDETFGYYETLAGGSGAGPGFRGQSAVQCHMTNTRITDVEVLEARFPVRVRRFAIRTGSGGLGQFAGGDGLVREIQALVPLDLTLLSQRRTTRPFGLAGGDPGLPGRNLIDGREVPGLYAGRLEPGQVLRIETPGGGGYGKLG